MGTLGLQIHGKKVQIPYLHQPTWTFKHMLMSIGSIRNYSNYFGALHLKFNRKNFLQRFRSSAAMLLLGKVQRTEIFVE
jgi:hypothetical protein